ncbi:MAG: hypothetical protein RX317_08530, partial [bacterium]|nr:hypothetical protein [bacterium]
SRGNISTFISSNRRCASDIVVLSSSVALRRLGQALETEIHALDEPSRNLFKEWMGRQLQ